MPKYLRHFFAKPPLKRAYLKVSAIGVREKMPAVVINRPQGTDGFLMMYFHTVVRAGDSSECPWIRAGQLYIWPPGEPQFYGNSKRSFLHSWVLFNGELITDVMRRIPPNTPIPLESPGVFEKFLSDLHDELVSHSAPDETIAGNLCENWLLDLKRSLGDQSMRQVPERLQAAREFMDAHFCEKLSLAQMASKAHWSPTHFSAQFRRYYDASPMDYVIRLRMELAVHLLSDINRSITEIAASVGYDDLYHFSKLFKKYRRLSPRAMRRSLVSDEQRERT